MIEASARALNFSAEKVVLRMTFWDNLHRNSGLSGDPGWRKFVTRWSIVSLLLIAVACYFSYGMFKFDEYYQVVEFVGYKLGKTPAAELPWEFREGMRPWLQPAIYYGAAKALMGLGIKNPFTLTMAFRAISGLCGWAAVTALMLVSNVLFGDERRRRLAVMLLAMLWLIPYLAVRTSAESMSCSFLSLGIAALLLGSETAPYSCSGNHKSGDTRPKRNFPPLALLVTGICFGLAFEFRFQVAFSTIGALAWICVSSSDSPRRTGAKLTLLCAASLVPVALGTLADRWGYGQWTFVPWNYVHTNLVVGKSTQFGVAPFWWYFVDMNANPLAPITLLWTVAMVVTWVRFPRNLITWVTLPFFVGHSLIPHKELRFLFPLVLLATFFFILAYVPEPGSRTQPNWLRTVWRWRRSWLAMALYGFNLLGLGYGCFLAMQPSVSFQKYVYDHYPHGCTMYLLGADTKSPYENVGLNMFFYRPPGFTLQRLTGTDELDATLRRVNLNPSPHDVLVVRDRVSPWPEQDSMTPPPKLVYRTYPPWMENCNYFGWLQRSKRFSLYALQANSNVVFETPNAEVQSTASRMEPVSDVPSPK